VGSTIESYVNGLKYLILTLEYAPIPISYGLKMSLQLVKFLNLHLNPKLYGLFGV
jgi:hypothetical protein